MTIAGLYVIVDLPHPHGLEPTALVEALIESGARVLQLRAKRCDTRMRVAMLEQLVPITSAAGVPLIVNDDIDAARAVAGVAGIHLGQADLERLGSDLRARQAARQALRTAGLCFGLSTHDLAQVDAARELGPDYIGFGPVFATTSKANPEPSVGLELLARAVARADVPIVAIGGIGPQQVGTVLATKVAAIAVISAVVAPTLAATRERCRDLANRLATTSTSV